MSRVVLIVFPLLSMLFPACTGSKKAVNSVKKESGIYKKNDLIEFYYGGTMNEILEKAKKEDKLVFVDITADWCAPCKVMDEEVFSYQPLYDFVNKNFISYRLDIDNSTDHYLAYMYKVKTVPAIIFLDATGRVLIKKESSVSTSSFMKLAKEAINKK